MTPVRRRRQAARPPNADPVPMPPEPVAVEHVLCVSNLLFRELGTFQGFSGNTRILKTLLSPAHARYLPRGAAEDDPSHKQLIPYCVLVARVPGINGPDGERVFAYERGAGGGEGRLAAKVSCGVGGHISTLDRDAAAAAAGGQGTGDDIYGEGMRRELEEEVEIPGGYDASLVGLINDDATEVGRVHLGVVHRLDLRLEPDGPAGGESAGPGPGGATLPQVRPREASMTNAGFRDPAALLAEPGRLESWTRIALEALFSGSPAAS